jgi:hypothetical protein
MGRFKPGEAGFDAVHINVHKTFSTPHGGGGPGAGPVGVGERLLPFLPSPRVLREQDGSFRTETAGERPTSIGRMRAFAGSTGVLVRAYAYIRAQGGSGLCEVSEDAVLAANYLKARLSDVLDVPFKRACMHEFVASAATLKAKTGIRTLDIAKRLIDYGYHPPTIYFPRRYRLLSNAHDETQRLYASMLGPLPSGLSADRVYDNEGAISRWRGGKPTFTTGFSAFAGALGMGGILWKPGDPESKGVSGLTNIWRRAIPASLDVIEGGGHRCSLV